MPKRIADCSHGYTATAQTVISGDDIGPGGSINVSEFTRITEGAVNEYFAAVSQILSAGQFSTTVQNPIASFPQMMIITTMPHHFAVELVGGRRTHRPLKVVKRELGNADLYFGQFNYPPDAKPGIAASGGGISTLAVITPDAAGELERRFPNVARNYLSHIQLVGEEFGPALNFLDSTQYFQVEDALLANALSGMVRIRHIRFALIVSKGTSREDYQSYLDEHLPTTNNSRLVAVQLIPQGKAETTLHAAQFANIFLMNKLHETSIGSFIDQHREILCSALEAQQLVSEPYLPWVAPSPDPEEEAINPDLFIQRSDGCWDVYDLKLALLNRKSLTTGKRNRRRFVSSIEDGVAQLAHYREFLAIPEHAALAEEKYNVVFNDPQYVLVVGNYENVNTAEIADARRRFPDLEIIDYDTLLQLYLLHENALPTQISNL